MTDDNYVTQSAWLNPSGRGDSIDEIADQFERPSGAADFWSGMDVRHGASIRAITASFVPRGVERRAG